MWHQLTPCSETHLPSPPPEVRILVRRPRPRPRAVPRNLLTRELPHPIEKSSRPVARPLRERDPERAVTRSAACAISRAEKPKYPLDSRSKRVTKPLRQRNLVRAVTRWATHVAAQTASASESADSRPSRKLRSALPANQPQYPLDPTLTPVAKPLLERDPERAFTRSATRAVGRLREPQNMLKPSSKPVAPERVPERAVTRAAARSLQPRNTLELPTKRATRSTPVAKPLRERDPERAVTRAAARAVQPQ